MAVYKYALVSTVGKKTFNDVIVLNHELTRAEEKQYCEDLASLQDVKASDIAFSKTLIAHSKELEPEDVY